MSGGPRAWPLAGAALARVWLAFAWPWLAGGQIIPWDAKAHFYPMIRFVARAVAEGESVLWSPYHYGGFPMIADPQSMILTPSFWPAILAGPDPSLALVDAVHLAHLLAAGLAVMAFGRLRGWGPAAALAAGLTAMLAGPVTLRLEHMLMTVSYMWLAVALWRLEALLLRGGLWRGAVFGLVLGILLIDRNHVAYLGAWVLFLYAAVRIWPLRADRIGPMALGGALALALAAVPVLLLLQLAGLSNRPGFGLADASAGSMPPAAFASALMPELFGSFEAGGRHWGPGSAAWGGELAVFRGMVHLYCGVLAVAAVLWGVATGALWRGERRFWLALSGGLAVYALGRYTPVFGVLYDVVPGVDLFRRPSDALIPLGLALAILTGGLVDAAIRGDRTPTRTGLAAASVLLLAAMGSVAAIALSRGESADLAAALLRLGIGLALTLTFLAGAPRRRAAAFAVPGLLALQAVDLATAHSGPHQNTLPPTHARLLEAPETAPHLAELQRRLAEPDPTGVPWRVEILGIGTSLQNFGQAAGVQSLLGYNPIRLRAFEEAIAPGHQNSAAPKRNFGDRMTSYQSPLARSLGLRYLLTGRSADAIDPAFAPDRARLIGIYDRPDERKAWLYELPDAEPRARLSPAGTVQVTRYGHAEIRLETACPAPCRLVLREFVYPGWEVWVDGRRAPLETEDGLFRAVDLPGGAHRVRFVFRPLSAEALGRAVTGLLGR
ncbi:MAG: hypothetical protein ACFBSD_08490 [Paracoccaceae bacterium]